MKPNCTDVYSACVCDLPLNHEGKVHTCSCGGSWERKDGLLRILSFPVVSDSGEPLPNIGLPVPGPWMPG